MKAPTKPSRGFPPTTLGGANLKQTVRKLAITPPLRKFDSRPVGEQQ
jgi:hypothetical protein